MDIDFDLYEHHVEGSDVVLYFHYAHKPGIEREVSRSSDGSRITTVLEGYFFAITRVTLKEGGENVMWRLSEFMTPDEVEHVVDFMETCLNGPPVPFPPDDHEGNWF